jgi:hypothetical protein
VTVEGPGILDVTAWRQKDSMTVHLVNLTNPMTMKGPLREFIPVPPQEVTIRLPKGQTVRAIHLLASGSTPRSQRTADWVRLTIPAIADHEVIAVDF